MPIFFIIDKKSYYGTMFAFKRLKSYMASQQELTERMSIFVNHLFDTVVEYTPEDSGDTKRAWKLERISNTEWMIYNPLPSAVFVEYSSQPHIIKPKDKEVLYFKVDGAEVFAAWVEHPGVKDPAAPMRRAYEKRKSILRRMEDEILEDLVKAWRK